jgi:hypothetical protein
MAEVRLTNGELMVWWPPRQDEPVAKVKAGGVARSLHHRDRGVAHNACELIAGHSLNNVYGETYVYRDQLALSLLPDALEKLRYEVAARLLTGSSAD